MSIRPFLGSIFLVWGLLFPGLRPVGAEEELPFRFVVHESNPTESLDRSFASKIYLGKITRWPDGFSIEPVDQEATSRVRADFSGLVHGKSVSAIQSFWQRIVFSGQSQPPLVLSGDAAVLEHVSSRRGAIGYVSASTPLGPGVRAVALTGRASEGFRSEPVPQSRDFFRQPLLRSLGRANGMGVWAGPMQGRLFRIRDGEASWIPAGKGLFDHRILGIASVPGSSELVAVTTRSVYRTSSVGGSWAFVESLSEASPLSLVVSPWEPTQLFLLTTKGLRRRDDESQKLEPLELEGVPPFSKLWSLPQIGLVASDGSDLWLGSQSGERWDLLSRLPIDGQVFDLAKVSGESRMVLAATSEGVLIGQDLNRGPSWKPVGLTGRFHAVLATSKAWLAANTQGLFVSTDSGSTWRPVAQIPNAALAIASASGDRVLALGSDGNLITSLDGGVSWRRDFRFLLPPEPPEEVLSVEAKPKKGTEIPPGSVALDLACGADRDHVAAIVVDLHDSSRVYAAGQAGVFRSVDFGASWQDASVGLEIRDVHTLAIDPENSRTLYAGTHGAGVFKSTDGAASWWPARRGLSDPVIHSLRVDPALPSMLQAGTPSGLFGSTDGGASWRWLGASAADHRAALSLTSDAQDLNRWLAGAQHGELWLGDSASIEGRFLHSRVKLSQASVAGQTELCNGTKTRNTSRRLWEDFGVELDGLRVRTCGFDADAEQGLFAGTSLGLFRSEDLGQTWRRLSLDANLATLLSVRISAEEAKTMLLAGTADGLWQGEDGGESWRRLPFDRPVVSVATDPALPSAIYAGSTGGRLGFSRDAGKTWREASLVPPLPSPSEAVAQRAPEARRAKAPKEVTAAAERLWRALWRISPRDPRRRALVATELLARAPAKLRKDVRGALERFLEEIRGYGRDVEPADVLTLGFSPGERWLLAWHGSESCDDCDPELRIFDLEEARFRAEKAPPPSGEKWIEAHDVSLEPPHLLPRWVMDDPGEILAWGHRDRYVATLDGTRGIRVWSLGSRLVPDKKRELLSPTEPPHRSWRLEISLSLCPGRDEEGSEEVSEIECEVALSGDGRRLAYVAETPEGASVRLARRQKNRTKVEEVWTLPKNEEEPVGWSFLRFTPDSTRLLGFASDGSLWMTPVDDVPVEPQPVFVDEPRTGTQEAWREIAFDPAGRWLAAFGRGDVWLWPIGGLEWPEAPESLSVAGQLDDLTFSPNGQWLAVDASDGETAIFHLEPRGPRARRWVRSHQGWPAVFSRDSRRWTSYGSFAQVLDLETDTPRVVGQGSRRHSPSLGQDRRHPADRSSLQAEQISGYGQPVKLLSLDRRWLATHERNDFRLWDLSDSPPQILHGQIERPWPPTTPDRQSPESNRRSPWPEGSLAALDTEVLRDLACAVVSRNLTPGEWRLWVGDEPWQPTCRWPIHHGPSSAGKGLARSPSR